MGKTVFSEDEFLLKTGISKETLAEWVSFKLVRPAGFSEDKTPIFAEDCLPGAAHIQKLLDLGYGLEEIQKILKKVGLPQRKSGKKAAAKDLFLTVGDLAERSGISARTIKHWEDKGLIDPDMRSEGGFRLYSEAYIRICQLIRDLQLFGYTLEEIKGASDHFRGLLSVREDMESLSKAEVESKLEAMLRDIQALFEKMKLLAEGIDRWDSLLKKERKDILSLQTKNRKRPDASQERNHA